MEKNPLLQPAMLEFKVPGMKKIPDKTKVCSVYAPMASILLAFHSDIIGAFDQPHKTEDGKPAHYPGKGIIAAAFEEWGKEKAAKYMPTDRVGYDQIRNFVCTLPNDYLMRLTLHYRAEKKLEAEFICRSTLEGSMAEKAEAGKLICGQKIPRNLKLGDTLDRPYFTPTDKAPKGQKDKPLTLEEYYDLIGDDDLANYLYGMTIVLHLYNRSIAREKGLDRLDQKMEFGIFSFSLPLNLSRTPSINFIWKPKSTEKLFNDLCLNAGMSYDAWKKMPLFNLERFCQFAAFNAKERTVGLIDEYGGTDDGRYRDLKDTIRGKKLVRTGESELGRVFIENYLCKEYFRLFSKKTGFGGYEAPASQEVVVPYSVLAETGRRNLRALLMLTV